MSLGGYPRDTVAATLSKYMGNAVKLADIWGTLIYNVKAFGAKGDGVTDDTLAIQSTIDDAEINGGVVYLPDGTYLVSQITVSNSVRFLSFGKATIKHSVFVGDMISIQGTGIEVSFDGLFFDGNNSAQVTESTNSIIEVRAVGTKTAPMYVNVTDCEFRNQCFASINFYSDLGFGTGQEYIYVDNSRFYGGNEGNSSIYDPKYISVNDGAIGEITRCIFDLQRSATQFGISGVVFASTNPAITALGSIIISECEFRGLGRYAANSLGAIDIYIFAQNITITDNKFYDSTASPIKTKTNSKNILISGNEIENVINGAPGINVSGNTTTTVYDSFIVQNNIIKNTGGSGIIVQSIVGLIYTDIIISGNELSTIGNRGIEMHYCSRALVIDNILKSISSLGMWFVNCSGHFTISRNILYTVGSFGIYGDTGDSGLSVIASNNQIFASTKYGIYFDSVDTLTLSHNISDSIVNSSGSVGYYVANVSNAVIIGNQTINSTTGIQITSVNPIIEQNNSWNGSQFYGTAAPTTGTWKVGDKVWQTVPVAAGYTGFVCTTAGTPGTWKGFGLIQA